MEIRYALEIPCKYSKGCTKCNGRYSDHGKGRTCYVPKNRIKRGEGQLEKGLAIRL